MRVFSSSLPAYLSGNLSAIRVGESSLMIRAVNQSQALSNKLTVIEKNSLLVQCKDSIIATSLAWLTDIVLAYESLLIEYDDEIIDHYRVIKSLQDVLSTSTLTSTQLEEGNPENQYKTHTIPVCYEYEHDEFPHDRDKVLAHTGLGLAELIDIHCDKQYRIFAVGFMPNFAYLGELEQSIHVPRLQNPRLKVPAGAVAIADNQTAVYPSKSPGGWHIIGYTPIDLRKHPDFSFVAGEQVRFVPISCDEFEKLKANNGENIFSAIDINKNGNAANQDVHTMSVKEINKHA